MADDCQGSSPPCLNRTWPSMCSFGGTHRRADRRILHLKTSSANPSNERSELQYSQDRSTSSARLFGATGGEGLFNERFFIVCGRDGNEGRGGRGLARYFLRWNCF